MSSDTLTVVAKNCTYINGYLHFQIATQETCELILLWSSVKPTRKRNPAIQEPGMKTHRWLWTMHEVHTQPQDTPGARDVHQFTMPFPQLNDTVYYTLLYAGLPDTTSPQAPIFAARVPLTLIYSTLWPTFPPDDAWGEIHNSPDSEVTATPGRVALFSLGGPFGASQISDVQAFRTPDAGPSARGLFVLHDGIWSERNNAQNPVYWIEDNIVEQDFSLSISTYQYGSISSDPCTFLGRYFVGNFRPNDPFLECYDLILNRTTDLCGDPFPVFSDPRLYVRNISVGGTAPAPAAPANIAAIRPYAVYTLAGPMQDISARWRYLRPLIPQTSSPKLEQMKYTPAP